MKTILHVIDSLGRGGAEILLNNTLEILPNFRNVVCYLNEPDDLKDSIEKNAKVFCLNHKSNYQLITTVFKLRRIIKNEKVDIIHSHLVTSTLIARLASVKVPLISTIHNFISKDAFEINKLSLFAERLTYSRKNHLIGVSEGVLDDYSKYVKLKGSSAVIYNFVDDSFFKATHKPNFNNDNELKLVAVGNLRRQKNYINILKAFTHIKDLPISLSIYGSGYLENDLLEYINKNNINVSLKGKSDDILSTLKNYDAYLMCSIFEGCPIAPIEALAFGMPLLLSDITSLKEIIGQNAVYCNPMDPKDIASKIEHIFSHWNSFIQLSSSNKSIALEKYTKEIYLNKLETLYNDVQISS